MATKVAKKRLGDVLLEQELITEDQMRECINVQRQSGSNLASILVEKGYLDEEDLVVTLSEQLGIPHIRVASMGPANRGPRCHRGVVHLRPAGGGARPAAVLPPVHQAVDPARPERRRPADVLQLRV